MRRALESAAIAIAVLAGGYVALLAAVVFLSDWGH
jgi:hypothetical protein